MRSESEDTRQELIEHVSNVDDVLGEIFLGMYGPCNKTYIFNYGLLPFMK